MKLIDGKDLTLAHVIELAQTMESVEKNLQSIKGHSSNTAMQRIHGQWNAAAHSPGKKQLPTMFDKLCH